MTFLSSDNFFHWLWRNSWQASVLVLLILAAQLAFRHRMSHALRSGLWLLVIVRLLWPMALESPTSVFNIVAVPSAAPIPKFSEGESAVTSSSQQSSNPINLLYLFWVLGVGILLAIISFNSFTLWHRIRRERPLTNSAILELLEDCKAQMRIHTPLTLIETRHTGAPFLYGFIRPRLLLPAGLTQYFSYDELRHIFLHELSHLKRADIPLNWLATILLILHWFNPFVWIAFARMRLDREFACDALALTYSGPRQNAHYGETIIRLVEQFSRPAWAPGVVGIIENKQQIKRRIEMIAQSPNRKIWRALAAILFVALGIVTFTEAQSNKDNKETATSPTKEAASPRIVKTSPEIGAKDVDPSTKEITITFDRDMAGGFSWTGGPPNFPPGREGQKPSWRDKRTCSLPVTLERGKYYRVGINSQTHQNFRSSQGVPAKPAAIYFTTIGATADLQEKTAKPQIVSMTPANGATDVDPKIKELRVSFNVPMGSGFSWTGGGPSFPPSSGNKKPYWSDDKKTCVLPVELKAGSEYRLGLNSASHKNFQSAGGVPLDPITYTFKTK